MKHVFISTIVIGALLVVSCGNPVKTPEPNKEFSLKDIGLTSINLPGNSLCQVPKGSDYYEVLLNDGIDGIRNHNVGFRINSDSGEAISTLRLFDELNNPDKSVVEALNAILKEKGIKVLEQFEFKNGFKGVLIEETSTNSRKGTTSVDTSYTAGLNKNNSYAFIENMGHDGTRYFDKVKSAIESIN